MRRVIAIRTGIAKTNAVVDVDVDVYGDGDRATVRQRDQGAVVADLVQRHAPQSTVDPPRRRRRRQRRRRRRRATAVDDDDAQVEHGVAVDAYVEAGRMDAVGVVAAILPRAAAGGVVVSGAVVAAGVVLRQ
jgi:hypothetical protein